MPSRAANAIHTRAQQRPSLLSGQANRKDNIEEGLLLFNFKFLDQSQGQTLLDWEKNGLLSQAVDVFKGYSTQKISGCFNDRFKCYKKFPEKTDFIHPRHVPEDALWASMHLQGKPCVIGHIHRNVFYVVFLDQDHRFYISDLQAR